MQVTDAGAGEAVGGQDEDEGVTAGGDTVGPPFVSQRGEGVGVAEPLGTDPRSDCRGGPRQTPPRPLEDSSDGPDPPILDEGGRGQLPQERRQRWPGEVVGVAVGCGAPVEPQRPVPFRDQTGLGGPLPRRCSRLLWHGC